MSYGDTFSSYTITFLHHNETKDSIRQALSTSVSTLRPTPSTKVVVRVDKAPGQSALKDDHVLQQHSIELDFGHIHNINKNPIAEKAI